MRYFLAKTEPSTYSIDDLERDQQTVWDGVTNPQAVKAILAMKKGDRVLIYHSGGVSAIVGWAKAASDGRADAKNPKSAVLDLQYGGRVEPPVTLADVKASGEFNDFALVRQSRLSTMPVPDEFVEWVRTRVPKAKL
jgi:predicted RNA-binding protein with PUA-like domain